MKIFWNIYILKFIDNIVKFLIIIYLRNTQDLYTSLILIVIFEII
jgi:hypothetical protein